MPQPTAPSLQSPLGRRLVADDVELIPGRVLQPGSFELDSYVTEPMRHGRVLLAGDAAHIVTPAGGKGMNLTLQGIDELVAGHLDHDRNGATSVSMPTAQPAFTPSSGPSSSDNGCSTSYWSGRPKGGPERGCGTHGGNA